ncbi:MAG: S8 family serine peptidase [Tatlockia sp.]|nr:S8 family serine peptidase [Tatlockia sp.]
MQYRAKLIGLVFLLFAHNGFAHNDATIRIIVKYKSKIIKAAIEQTINLPLKSLEPMAGSAYVLTFDKKIADTEIKQDLTATILAKLRKNSNVLYALEDRKGYFKPLPQLNTDDGVNLLSHESQWNEFSAPAGIMLESAANLKDGAWALSTGESEKPIVVAVLDTGISPNPALIDNLVKDKNNQIFGWNFSANNSDLVDETHSYHGTHVAGIIAGYGEIMRGVGEHLKILALKIPNSEGLFYESQVINALYWSVGGEVPGIPTNIHPAKVLNMSFGIDETKSSEMDHCDLALQEALNFVRKKGAVIIAAAGNENHWENYSAPAVCNEVIKVAATGPGGLRANYSNYGPSISFAAPGGDQFYNREGGILSTVNPGGGYRKSGYDFYQGTSMASPHAAGVAALLYALNSFIKPDQVEQLLYATAHPFSFSQNSNNSCLGYKSCGSGILDANNAVKATLADYDEIITMPTTTDFINKNSRNKKQWSKIKSQSNLPKHQLSQTKEGIIIANYEKVAYIFDDKSFKYCQLIGALGIGCYR